MNEKSNSNPHLEMMIQKQNRCEDWVAAVALRKQNKRKRKRKKKNIVDTSYIDEFSDVIDNDENQKRKTRKPVRHSKSFLILTCEWRNCNFQVENNRMEFWSHVSFHVQDLAIVEKLDLSECYECLWDGCSFQASDVPEVKRHVNYHSYHTILKASAQNLHSIWDFQPCQIDLENRNWLPDLSYPFECNEINCNFFTNDYMKYLMHVEIHTNSLEFNWKKKTEISCFWKGCTFKCRSKNRMKSHIRRHTGEKMVACPTCGAMFSTNTKYMDHCTRKFPVKVENNRCQYCLRYFSSERLLRDHMRYHVNSHKCSFCDMTCPTPSTLANHIRYRHLNVRPFQCNQCPFRSVNAEDCNGHMFTHDVEPRFQCEADNCNYSCKSVIAFKKHFKLVHLMETLPVYCCHLCDKKYNRGHLLGNHLLQIHKLERPSGHTRFRYMQNLDGFYRLQVERYESLEVNNVETQIPVNSQPREPYIIRQESPDERYCRKFTVCVDDKNKPKGALIAIDVLDEKGNIINTSTVREEYLDDLSNTDITMVNETIKSSPNDVALTSSAAFTDTSCYTKVINNENNKATGNKNNKVADNENSEIHDNKNKKATNNENHEVNNNKNKKTTNNENNEVNYEYTKYNIENDNLVRSTAISINLSYRSNDSNKKICNDIKTIIKLPRRRQIAVLSDVENIRNDYSFWSSL